MIELKSTHLSVSNLGLWKLYMTNNKRNEELRTILFKEEWAKKIKNKEKR